MSKPNKDGSEPLRGKAEDYCQTVVNEPYRRELEIYEELYPDKNNPSQSHNAFKNGVFVKARVSYLSAQLTQEARNTLDDEIGRLRLTANNLYKQSCSADGKIKDLKVYNTYMATLEMLHKLEGKYNHKTESTVTVETTSEKKARIADLLNDD